MTQLPPDGVGRHTPGPWVPNNGHREVLDSQRRIVAKVMQYNPSFEERFANAQLIAMAPDLLSQRDELKKAPENIVANAVIQPDDSMKGSTDCYAVPLDDIDAARTALQNASAKVGA